MKYLVTVLTKEPFNSVPDVYSVCGNADYAHDQAEHGMQAAVFYTHT